MAVGPEGAAATIDHRQGLRRGDAEMLQQLVGQPLVLGGRAPGDVGAEVGDRPVQALADEALLRRRVMQAVVVEVVVEVLGEGETAGPAVQLPKLGNHRHRAAPAARLGRSDEHTSEFQSLLRISYAVFCWKKKKQ